VSAALGIQHAKAHAPHYIVICGLSDSSMFSHIITLTALFSGKKVTERKMCVFIFSIT
jgi:hypothetical protein